jgi:uncharacterized membrane protein
MGPSYVLAAILIAAGVGHFVAPEPFRRIVPRWLGHAPFLVAASGVAELATGGLVLVPRTRRLGGALAAVLFVTVFPANIQMALDGGMPDLQAPLNSAMAAWLRLPLQIPLVLLAVAVGRGRRRPASAT